MRTIEFWYEIASTYSYPAAMRAGAIAERGGARLSWRPFLLGPIFADQGWTDSPFNLQPVKGAYMWRDLERTCAKIGIPFTRPDPFPQNGLHAARLALALPDDGARARFSRAAFHAQFANGQAISDPEVLRGILTAEEFDADDLTVRATAPENKLALRAETERARALGIFGAPTWRAPDGEIFWGNDRLEDALAWVMEKAA